METQTETKHTSPEGDAIVELVENDAGQRTEMTIKLSAIEGAEQSLSIGSVRVGIQGDSFMQFEEPTISISAVCAIDGKIHSLRINAGLTRDQLKNLAKQITNSL
tara:strand:+ start:161 stop:475 length:315 start_codon:yes stop_codon:yes gene_type:complete